MFHGSVRAIQYVCNEQRGIGELDFTVEQWYSQETYGDI